VKGQTNQQRQNRGTTMKSKLTERKFKCAPSFAKQLSSGIACLGAAIVICSSAWAQNLFVSGNARLKNCRLPCGVIYKFTWDGGQSIFTVGLDTPLALAFDNAGNLFVVDYEPLELVGPAAIYKITPNGTRTIFASGLSYPSYLAVDKTGNVFLADYEQGIIYKYKPNGSRATFASGLYHPTGLAFDSLGDLFVADNSVGNIYQGSIYQYKPDGSRVTFAVLDPADRPADLAFDRMGNLLMADLGGNIYKYDPPGVLRRHARTTFGSVPNSAQSLACDGAGNLLVVDPGGVNGAGSAIPNAIYKFTPQGARSTFASGQALSGSFAWIAFQPISCCE
jgi:hypothetical protein